MPDITQLSNIGLDSEGYSSHDTEQIAINVSRNNYRAALRNKIDSVSGIYEATMNYVRSIHRSTKLRMLEAYGDIGQLPKNASTISENVLNQQLAETLIIRLDKKELQRIAGKVNADNAALRSQLDAARKESNTYFSLGNVSTAARSVGTGIRNKKDFVQAFDGYQNFKLAKFMYSNNYGYSKLAKEIDSLLKALTKEELGAKAYGVGIDFEPGTKSNVLRHYIANQCCAYVALVTGKTGPEVGTVMGGKVVDNIKDILRYTSFSWVAGVSTLTAAEINDSRKYSVMMRGMMQQRAKLAKTKPRYKDMRTRSNGIDTSKKLVGNWFSRNIPLFKQLFRLGRRRKKLDAGAEAFIKISKRMLAEDPVFSKWVIESLNDLIKYINNVKANSNGENFDITQFIDTTNKIFNSIDSADVNAIFNKWSSIKNIEDKLRCLTDKDGFGIDHRASREQKPNTFLARFDSRIRKHIAAREYMQYPYDPTVSTRALIAVYMENEFAQRMAILRASKGKTLGTRIGDSFKKFGGLFSRRVRNNFALEKAQRELAADDIIGGGGVKLAKDENGDLLLNDDNTLITESDNDSEQTADEVTGLITYNKKDANMLSRVKRVQPVFIANNFINDIKLVKVTDSAPKKSDAEWAVPVVIMGSVGMIPQNIDRSDDTDVTNNENTYNTIFRNNYRNELNNINNSNLPELGKMIADPTKFSTKTMQDAADSINAAKHPELNSFNSTHFSDISAANDAALNTPEYDNANPVKHSDAGDTISTSDNNYWSKYASKYWREADVSAKVKPVFVTNSLSKLDNIADNIYSTEMATSSIFNFLNTQLPILFMGLQMGGMAVNAAAAGASAAMVSGTATTVANTALRTMQSGFATGGNIKAKSKTQFVSGDSLNYKPNPELVSVDWSNKSVSVKPLHYTPVSVPHYATGVSSVETPNGSNSSRMSLHERNSALDVNIATGVVKYTNQLTGVTDDGTNTAVKVYSINSPLTDKIDIGGNEVSLIELIYGMNMSLSNIDNGIRTQTELLSNIATSKSVNTSDGGGETASASNNFKFPTNLDSILAGE